MQLCGHNSFVKNSAESVRWGNIFKEETMGKRVVVALLVLLIATNVVFAGGSTEAADDDIHIALSAPITGDWSEFGIGFERSVRMAIEQLNADGGVLDGRKFRLSVGDTEGNPQMGTTLAQRFTSDRTVVAQIGPFASSTAMAAQPIFDAEGVVQLSPTASHADFAGGSPWSFGIVGTQRGEGPFNADFAYNHLGLRRVAVLHLNNDFGIDSAHYFSEAFKEMGGEIVDTEFYFDGERDFTAVLTKLAQTNADGLYIVSFYNDGAAINLQRQRIGWDVQVLGTGSLYNDQLIALGGDAVEGVCTATVFYSNDPDPRVVRYVEAFREKYGETPSFHAAVAYDAMMLLADAIERAGSTDRRAIRDAMAATVDFDNAVAGSVTFTPEGDAVKGYRRLVINGGKFQLFDIAGLPD
jgi:branched-chain amino acid transport system substrate-binding protein